MLQTALLFIGGIGIMEILLILIFLAAPAIIWLWAIIDLLRSDFKDSTIKLIWLVVVAFIPFLGALLYLLIGRSQKIKSVTRI